jgi:hypothetical protein
MRALIYTSLKMFSNTFLILLPLAVKLPERFGPVERMSLQLRSSEKTSRLDFAHP